jgi:hypothetical protein
MRRASFIVAAVALLATWIAAPLAAQEDESSRVTLQVLNQNKQPVADAHVVIRFTEERLLRRDKRVSWEAKTNRKGVVVLNDIPRGEVKVQIIAKGFQTYGDQHAISKPEEEVTVQLLPPKGQVSAY